MGSEDHTQINCNKLSKELYDDNKICLEIYSVASLSTSYKTDAIYTNKFDPHDVVMNIPVPKCSEGANKPFSIFISELIGAVTSRRILRVIFDLWLKQLLINKRSLPEAACIKTCKNLNPMTNIGGMMQLIQTVMLEQISIPKFNKKLRFRNMR